MNQETVGIKGWVTTRLIHADGTEEVQEFPNLVVTTGDTYICNCMIGSPPTIMNAMAVGTSSTAASAGQTALVAEVGRVALTSTTLATNVITYVANFPAGTATGSLNEAGIFNNVSTGGIMLCRTVFAATVVKASTDILQITWTVTVT